MVLMLASPDARALAPAKAVLLGETLTVFDLVVTARTGPVGLALTAPGTDPRTVFLLKLWGIPAIADVRNAFRWIAPGDVALLDADHGFLVVNPTRAEVAALRAQHRSSARGAGADESAPPDTSSR